MKQFDKYLSIATRLAFLFYWIFDNLAVLTKIKFFTSLDFANVNKWACRFWLLGLLLGLWQAVHNLLEAAKYEIKLKLEKLRIGQEGSWSLEKWNEESKKSKAKILLNSQHFEKSTPVLKKIIFWFLIFNF